MPMEGQVKFFSTQNIAGVSQEESAAKISQTIDVNGDWVSNVKNNINHNNKTIKYLHTACSK